MMQIMTAKTTTLRTLHVHAVLNFKCDVSIFFFHDIVLNAQHFLPVKFFSQVLL